jgi:hypothetical protein
MVLAADAWTKRSMAVFDKEVLQPLLRSKPSQLALQNGRVSTEHTKAYLIKAEARNRAQQRRLRQSIDDAKMPADLQALIQAQSSDGKWWPSSAVTAALGGQHRIPAAPAGFDSSDWRWITALKEAHVRLPPHPDELYYALDAAAVQQGTWLQNTQQLLNRDGYESFTGMKPTAAHSSVIDSKTVAAVVSGNTNASSSGSSTKAALTVQQSTTDAATIAQSYEQHSGLKTELHDAKQRAKCQFSVGEHVECRWRRLAGRLSHATIDSTNWHRAVISAVRKSGTVDVRFCEPMWPDESERNVAVQHVRKAPESTAVSSVQCDSSAIDVVNSNSCSQKHDASSLRELAHISGTSSAIQSNWAEAITMNRELKRLKQIKQRTAKARPEFITTFDPTASFSEAAATQDKSSLKTRKRTTDSGTVTAQRTRAIKATAHTTTVTDRSSSVVQAISDVTGSTTATDTTANTEQQRQQQQQCADDRVAAEAQAVIAIMAYEDCLSAVKQCLSTSLNALPAAKTYTAQAAVLEELRVRLGLGHIARTINNNNSNSSGSSDSAWRSQHITGLHSATLAAVEAVALLQELSVKEGAILRPFFWAGKPFLLSVPQQLNFLSSAHAAPIRMFYGKDFPTLRNPFCMCYSLDTRPCTPRKSRVKSIVNGEACMTVDAALEQQHLREVAAVTAVQTKQCKQIPPWWPCYGLEEKQFIRLRQAEAVLLREERQFAHWLIDTTSTKASSASSSGVSGSSYSAKA